MPLNANEVIAAAIRPRFKPRKLLSISLSGQIDFSIPLADIHEFFRTLE
jgi:hypothetical protein